MNNTTIGLTPEELYQITHFRYAKKQINALVLMEIPFKVRPDGTVFVARADIEGAYPPVRLKELSSPWVIDM